MSGIPRLEHNDPKANAAKKQEGVPMYDWLAILIVGWAGSHRWFGDAVDAPNPRDPHPWEYLALGALGGIAAVFVSRLGVANSEPMPGLLVAFATGSVAAGIARAGIGRSRK